MSADNWAQCPRCLRQANDDYAILIADVGKKYGKVPPDEYMELVASTENRPEVPTEFREDYEFHMSSSGMFRARYHGQCRICGFKHSFKHEEKLRP